MRSPSLSANQFWKLLPLLSLFFTECSKGKPAVLSSAFVSKWDQFERALESSVAYSNPVQDAFLRVTVISPSGDKRLIDGFWDGGRTWKFRFSPNELGKWTYATACSDAS